MTLQNHYKFIVFIKIIVIQVEMFKLWWAKLNDQKCKQLAAMTITLQINGMNGSHWSVTGKTWLARVEHFSGTSFTRFGIPTWQKDVLHWLTVTFLALWCSSSFLNTNIVITVHYFI